jgi:hypothetical protein
MARQPLALADAAEGCAEEMFPAADFDRHPDEDVDWFSLAGNVGSRDSSIGRVACWCRSVMTLPVGSAVIKATLATPVLVEETAGLAVGRSSFAWFMALGTLLALSEWGLAMGRAWAGADLVPFDFVLSREAGGVVFSAAGTLPRRLPQSNLSPFPFADMDSTWSDCRFRAAELESVSVVLNPAAISAVVLRGLVETVRRESSGELASGSIELNARGYCDDKGKRPGADEGCGEGISSGVGPSCCHVGCGN